MTKVSHNPYFFVIRSTVPSTLVFYSFKIYCIPTWLRLVNCPEQCSDQAALNVQLYSYVCLPSSGFTTARKERQSTMDWFIKTF